MNAANVLRDIDILRAHAIAAALRRARPSKPRNMSPEAASAYTITSRGQWWECVRQVASVVCTAEGVNLNKFYDLCGVDE